VNDSLNQAAFSTLLRPSAVRRGPRIDFFSFDRQQAAARRSELPLDTADGVPAGLGAWASTNRRFI